MKPTKVLFLVNGLGLGNSTRSHAVIQRLAAKGAIVQVVTSDNGLWFFADKPEINAIHAVPSLRYGKKNGRLSIAATLGQAREMWQTVRTADRVVQKVIADFRPDVVVSDSNYNFRPVKRAGIPLVGLNNADMVVRGMSRFRDRPASVLPQFYGVELWDYTYHRFVPDLVLSPRLDPADTAETGPYRGIGPIVRQGFEPQPLASGAPTRVVIMLSGSVFGSPVNLSRKHQGLAIDVLGRPAPEGFGEVPGLTYHGKVANTLPFLERADLVVINGGFSAVSEVLVLRKPAVVIPVPRHAEQWINARTMQHLGIGAIGEEERLEQAMEAALLRLDEYRDGYRHLAPAADGAALAARLILETAG